MELTYRPVRSMPQRNAVLTIYRGALDYFRRTAQPAPTRGTVQTDRHHVPAGCSSTAKRFDLLYADAQPVGVLDLVMPYPTVDAVYLQLLLVPRQLRHRGIGSAVVAHLRKQYGPTRDWLLTTVINADAAQLQFWQQAGFAVLNATRVAKASGDWQTETTLRLAL